MENITKFFGVKNSAKDLKSGSSSAQVSTADKPSLSLIYCTCSHLCVIAHSDLFSLSYLYFSEYSGHGKYQGQTTL